MGDILYEVVFEFFINYRKNNLVLFKKVTKCLKIKIVGLEEFEFRVRLHKEFDYIVYHLSTISLFLLQFFCAFCLFFGIGYKKKRLVGGD